MLSGRVSCDLSLTDLFVVSESICLMPHDKEKRDLSRRCGVPGKSYLGKGGRRERTRASGLCEEQEEARSVRMGQEEARSVRMAGQAEQRAASVGGEWLSHD